MLPFICLVPATQMSIDIIVEIQIFPYWRLSEQDLVEDKPLSLR